MLIGFTPDNSLLCAGQQTVRAALELGVVVGVCLMMGLGFMAMVGLELFCDWVVEEYR